MHHQHRQQLLLTMIHLVIIIMVLVYDNIVTIYPSTGSISSNISYYHSRFSSVYGYIGTIQQQHPRHRHRHRRPLQQSSYQQQYQSSLLLIQQRLSLLRLQQQQQSNELNEYDNNNNNNSDDTAIINQNNEIDLFDYFDPLLSPHSYPNGIMKPTTDTSTTTTTTTVTTVTSVESNDSNNDTSNTNNNIISNDDFGWTTNRNDDNRSMKKSYQMKKPFGISLPTTTEVDDTKTITTTNKEQKQQQRPMINVLTTFDPTLSPHLYTNGYVPDTIIGDVQEIKQQQQPQQYDTSTKTTSTKTIGILLIDHGSKNDASNIRLEELAQLYQNQYYTNNNNNNKINVIVQAVHMEIAKPSILDGLKSLLSYNSSNNNNENNDNNNENTTPIIVSEIICHPYFLSPGRHVQTDIPQLIQDAIIQIQNDYTNNNENNNNNTTIQQQEQQQYILPPIKITKPIGSQTNMMLNAIHTSIQETSEFI